MMPLSKERSNLLIVRPNAIMCLEVCYESN